MSHELGMSRGRAAVMVAGEAAWHKLGVNVSAAVTSEEAMKLALLDWTVDKVALTTVNGTDVPGWFANVRNDTGSVLGVVSEKYKAFQNADAFKFMDGLAGEKLAMYETAGSLKGGRVVWMMVKLPKEYRVNKTDDVVNPYVLMSTTHDGTGAVNVLPTSVRVVCANTLAMAMGRAQKASMYSVKHTKGLEAKVEDAREKLGLVTKGFDRFMEKVDVVAAFKMNDTAAKNYFTSFFPTEKKKQATDVAALLNDGGKTLLDSVVDQTLVLQGKMTQDEATDRQFDRNKKVVEQLMKNFTSDPTNTLAGVKGTAWGAYNSLSQYVDHQKTSRGKDDKARLENRVYNTLFGSGRDMKADAFASAFSLTQAV